MSTQVLLTAIDDSLTRAWERFCGDLAGVKIHDGSILETTCDAIVSPANSFGFMDGGIDALYLRYFGTVLQQRVQQMIADRHHGEMLVGTADIIETEDANFPFLVVAPTMRVPMKLTDSVNPYLAARAILLLVQQGNFASGPHVGQPIRDVIRTISLPGLGTGVGGISPTVCARQVRAAIDNVWLGIPATPRSWAEASQQHQLLYTDWPRRLQNS